MEFSNDSSATAGRTATERPFTAYDIQACLYDTRRVRYLRSAITQTVKHGDVVVDAGSGTGLLGLFAAQAGAARVYCLEINPDFIPIVEQNAVRNGLADVIVAIHADATTFEVPEPVDVLISEVISAGFFYEPQLQIVNNLRRFLKPGGATVPMSMTNYVELIHAQDEVYGLRLDFDSRFTELEGDQPLTIAAGYLTVDFRNATDPHIHCQEQLLAKESGIANAVRISYNVHFTESIYSGESSPFFLNPQIIFLPKPLPIVAGREYEITLQYEAGRFPITCRMTTSPARGKGAQRHPPE